jgi:hypothetical protein
MPEAWTEFGRCPSCRRTEVIQTGQVIAGGNQRHDRCGVEVENRVRFKPPADWCPAEWTLVRRSSKPGRKIIV